MGQGFIWEELIVSAPFHQKESAEVIWILRTPPGCLLLEVSGHVPLTQNSLEGPYVFSVLGTPWGPPEGAGERQGTRAIRRWLNCSKFQNLLQCEGIFHAARQIDFPLYMQQHVPMTTLPHTHNHTTPQPHKLLQDAVTC